MSKTLKIIMALLLVVICAAATILAIWQTKTKGIKAPQDTKTSKVTIRGYYEEPESLHDKETVILQGVLAGEFLEVEVQGTIKDFEVVRLEWDDQKNELAEKEVIHRIEILNDQTLVIKTYMPEGIPSEKLKWESLSGKQYEFIVSEDLSDDSEHLWEYVLD